MTPQPTVRERRIVVGAVIVALVPLLVLAARVVGRNHPALNGDDALIHLRVHDVGGAHTPLVGSYQRYGFNQPGPGWFYVLAVPFRLFGSRFSAIQIGVVLVHALSIVLVARVMLRRFGAIAAMWAVLVFVVLLSGLGPVAVTDPWEPHMIAVLLCTVTVLAFDAAWGSLGAWVWLVVIGSLTAQMSSTALPGVVALVCWGLAVGTVRLVRSGAAQTARRRLGGVVGVGALVWLPIAIEQFRHNPGNVTRMLRFVGHDHATLGLGDAFAALRLEMWFPAVWVGAKVPLVPFATTIDVGGATWFPLSLLVVAGIGVLVWHVHASEQLLLVATIGVLFVATLLSLSQLVLPFFVWLIDPTRAVGAALWLPLGTIVVLTTNVRVRHFAVAGVAVALVAATAVFAVRSTRDNLGPAPEVSALSRLAHNAVPALRLAGGPVLVHTDVKGQLFAGAGFGRDELAVDLTLAGIDVVVDSKPNNLDAANRFGTFRANPGRAKLVVVLQVAGHSVASGATVIAKADPLGPGVRTRRDQLRADVARVCGIGDLHVLKRCRDAHTDVARWLDELAPIPDLPAFQLVLLKVT